MTAVVFRAFLEKSRRPVEAILLAVGWVLIAGIAGYAVWLRLQIPRMPLSDPDTWGYLVPAISWIDGFGFMQSNGRGWLYPAFVAACLRFGDFQTLLAVQLGLGLLSGLFFVLAWRAWTRILPPIPLVGAAAFVAVTPLLAVFLCNPQTIMFEAQIRPEAIMNLAVFAQLYCVLRYILARWRGGSARAVMTWGGLAILFAYVAFELKPSWALAVPLTCLPMGLGLIRGWRIDWPSVKALGLALVLMVLLLVPKKLFFKPDQESRTFLPMVLFALHADLINADMHEHPSHDPKEAEFMAEFDRELTHARTKEHNYENLGFDPDYLMFGSPFFYTVRQYAGGTRDDLARFCREAYLNAAGRKTGGLIRKISRQFFTHFILMKESTLFRKRLDWQRALSETLTSIPPDALDRYKGHAGTALGAYLDSVRTLAVEKNTVTSERVFLDIVGRLTRSFQVWQGLFVLALAGAFFWPPLHQCRLAGGAALLLYSAPFGNALTVSIIHALDISRYRYSYGGPLLLAIGALIVFTVVVAGLAALTTANRFISAKKP